MNNPIVLTIVRGVITYVLALILTRLSGRKLISQMTFFDFIVGVTMGSIAANLAMGPQNTPTTASTALITLFVLALITSFIHIRSFKFRKVVDSEPVMLIDNGSIVESNMKRTRLTLDELTMKLREKNMFNLADVEFAIMETDGQLSVLPKADKSPLTPSDMKIQTTSSGLMRDVIIDGNIMSENLSTIGLDDNWLKSELNKQGIQNPQDVFYAGLDNQKKLYISKRNASNTENHGKYGIE